MNSDQEASLFEQYGWEYNYVRRTWVAPNDREITTDQIMKVTGSYGGDLGLMALIVENGVRQESRDG